jgi:hypothetical protein
LLTNILLFQQLVRNKRKVIFVKQGKIFREM